MDLPVHVCVLMSSWPDRYTLGTVLSFYNKMLVGKDSRIFNEEPFPAPLFMAGMQFAMQHAIARLVFSTGLTKRTADSLGWPDWFKSSGYSSHATVFCAYSLTYSYLQYHPCGAVVPNGACTGLDIGFSMMSLVFISLSFYTMCKATVPLFLLAFAFMWGIEK
jgi:solute carrier family 35 protein C2